MIFVLSISLVLYLLLSFISDILSLITSTLLSLFKLLLLFKYLSVIILLIFEVLLKFMLFNWVLQEFIDLLMLDLPNEYVEPILIFFEWYLVVILPPEILLIISNYK